MMGSKGRTRLYLPSWKMNCCYNQQTALAHSNAKVTMTEPEFLLNVTNMLLILAIGERAEQYLAETGLVSHKLVMLVSASRIASFRKQLAKMVGPLPPHTWNRQKGEQLRQHNVLTYLYQMYSLTKGCLHMSFAGPCGQLCITGCQYLVFHSQMSQATS